MSCVALVVEKECPRTIDLLLSFGLAMPISCGENLVRKRNVEDETTRDEGASFPVATAAPWPPAPPPHWHRRVLPVPPLSTHPETRRRPSAVFLPLAAPHDARGYGVPPMSAHPDSRPACQPACPQIRPQLQELRLVGPKSSRPVEVKAAVLLWSMIRRRLCTRLEPQSDRPQSSQNWQHLECCQTFFTLFHEFLCE